MLFNWELFKELRVIRRLKKKTRKSLEKPSESKIPHLSRDEDLIGQHND